MNVDNKNIMHTKNKLNLLPKSNTSKKLFHNNTNINIGKNKNNININKDNNDDKIPKPKFNIDLFLGVKEQFQKNEYENNNIYLNFYNKNTKNQVLKKENKISKKFLENNKEYIKEKQEKFKKKKLEEEKIKKQKEKEDTNEYRKLQMIKLYKVEDIYKKEIAKRKNNNKNKNSKYFPQKKDKISIIAKNKENIKTNIINKKEEINNNVKDIIEKNDINEIKIDNDIKIKITREEYDKKLDSLIKQTRIYLNELEKLPIANKSSKVYERELELNKYINEIQEQIKKYQLLDGLEIVEK